MLKCGWPTKEGGEKGGNVSKAKRDAAGPGKEGGRGEKNKQRGNERHTRGERIRQENGQNGKNHAKKKGLTGPWGRVTPYRKRRAEGKKKGKEMGTIFQSGKEKLEGPA